MAESCAFVCAAPVINSVQKIGGFSSTETVAKVKTSSQIDQYNGFRTAQSGLLFQFNKFDAGNLTKQFKATAKKEGRSGAKMMASGPAAMSLRTEAAAREQAEKEAATPQRKLNVGVIGAGRIGTVHADNLAYRIKNAKLAAVASGSKASAERCSLLTGCRVVPDYQDMLEDPTVDAIVICTASDTHTKIILEAAAAGKHIFCEKPVDLKLENVEMCKKAVEEAGVKLMVGLNRRFDANFMRVKKAIETKEMGDLHMLHITSRDPAPPPISYVLSSGGMFLDMTMHDFDMALFLNSGAKVTELFCMAGNLVDPEIGKAGDVDTSVISLRFDNGVIATIDNSRQAVYGYDQRVEAFGSKGSISTLNNYPNNAIISTGSEIKRDLPLNFFMDRYADSFVNIMSDFVTNVLEDKPMSIDINGGRNPVILALAAKKSYEENRIVKIGEIAELEV